MAYRHLRECVRVKDNQLESEDTSTAGQLVQAILGVLSGKPYALTVKAIR